MYRYSSLAEPCLKIKVPSLRQTHFMTVVVCFLRLHMAVLEGLHTDLYAVPAAAGTLHNPVKKYLKNLHLNIVLT